MNRASRATVSVVIPVFNAARHLCEAIDSVLNQTVPADEIIVVDDGSTDESLAIVAGYGALVRVVRQANLGASAARNLGAEMSRCEWVAYLDADDYWFPEKLKKQLALIARDPAADVVYSGKRDMFEDGRSADVPAIAPRMLRRMLAQRNWIHPTTAMVRRRVVLAHPWPVHLKSSEDWLFFYELLKVAKFAAVTEPTAIYRLHQDSLTHRNWRELMQTAQVVADAIAKDFAGLERFKLQGRVSARILASAAIAARNEGTTEHLGLIARSIAAWPFPSPDEGRRTSQRYKLAAKMFQQSASRWAAFGAVQTSS